MTDRTDAAIRADLARASDYLAEVVATSEHSPWGAAFRLAADVAPLLARAVAAEARAESAERLIARQLGDCTGCTTEPEETCPRDGRTYTEWVDIASRVIGRTNAVRDLLDQTAHWHVYEPRELGEAFLVDTVRDWIDEVRAALDAWPEEMMPRRSPSQRGARPPLSRRRADGRLA
jgi:hypothetical protein